eukprot:Nitzschia sp. Nitz4//scaffold92_size79448//63941//64821//NITZ4_005400-RA/size79448-augustus-gene-0.26-mRNA-1//1//CDS//3329560213//6752//frame0
MVAESSAVKAILFDMDGTLLDTESLSDKAVLLAFGSSLPPEVLQTPPMSQDRLPWDLKRQMLGLRGTEWAPIALSYGTEKWGVTQERNPPSPEEFWKNWEVALNSMCEQVDACAGASELVVALSQLEPKIPMAIATSSRYAGVESKKVRHTQTIFQYMTAIVAGDHPAVKVGKPAPDIYLEAARQLGVDPAECLVFEDALSGVRAGKAAGCKVVAIPDPRFTEAEKAAFVEEADVVVDSLCQFQGKPFGLEVDMTTTPFGTK